MNASPPKFALLHQLGDVNTGHVARGLIATGHAAPGDFWRHLKQSRDILITSQVQKPTIALLSVLRRVRPRLTLAGKVSIVTRAADVRRVLSDSRSYRVTPYAHTMNALLGPFALGQDGDAHAASRALLAEALSVIDLEQVGRQSAEHSARLVNAGCADGYLELVGDLAHPVLTGIIWRWFGLPADPAITGWATSAFEAVFLNSGNDRAIRLDGQAAMNRLADQAKRGLSAPTPGTVAAALLAAHDGVDAAAVDVVGLLVASVATVTEALLQVVNELLDRPEVMAQATAAAEAGDTELLWAHARECLRFSPQGPALVRTPAHGGLPVMVSTLSAMHDPAMVACPHAYRSDRPSENYLHFGFGPHACLGEPLAAVVIPSMLGALLRLATLSRSAREDGRLDASRAIPEKLRVVLSPRQHRQRHR